MPTPVFVVCSESISQDRETNKLSIFSIIERLNLRIGEKPDGTPEKIAITAFRGRLTAVWMFNPGEVNIPFEHEVAFLLPPNGEELLGPKTDFLLREGFQFYRFITPLVGFPAILKSGTLNLVSRVRRVGDSDWISQSCPVFVSVNEPSTEMKSKMDSRASAGYNNLL